MMLRAFSHQALGKPVEALAAESRSLLEGNGQTGPAVPDEGSADSPAGSAPDGMVARTWQDQMLYLLELGSAGNHDVLGTEVQDIRNRNPGGPHDDALRALGLTLQANGLSAAGRAAQGLDAALLAAS